MTRKKKTLTREQMAQKMAAHLSKAFHEEHKVTVDGCFIHVDRGDGRSMYAGLVLPRDERTDLQKLADVKED